VHMINKFKLNEIETLSQQNDIKRAVTPSKTRISERDNEEKIDLKKLKRSLIEKYSEIDDNETPLQTEITNYLSLNVKSVDDVLYWWKNNKHTYKTVAKLAQIILGIPATSSPAEEIFSTTGLILSAKRVSLGPENLGKIQYIHDNYSMFKD
ncbi:unnamed protein product, partial [Didymodactylos carnosus]